MLLALSLLLAFLWTGGYEATYRAILGGFGLNLYKPTPPFLDTRAVLSAIECHAAGFDVFRYNPCDPGGRPHVYGSAWLLLASLGLNTSMTLWFGAALDLAFLAALFRLPGARTWPEVAISAPACVSPAVILALERANNDLVVWLLALMMAWLAVRGRLARMLAYGLASLAALLKFYPVVLLALLVREKPWRAAAIGLPLSAVLAWWLYPEIRLPLHVYALTNYNVDMFGASKLVFAIVPMAASEKWLQWLVTFVLAAYLASLAIRLIGQYELRSRIASLPDTEAMMALAGAIMLIACFFAGLSVSYRAIHLLLVLPAILRLWREAGDRPARRFLMMVSCTVVWCLWSQTIWSHLMPRGVNPADMSLADKTMVRVLVAISELGWWWLIGVLIALTAGIVRVSPAITELRDMLVSPAH